MLLYPRYNHLLHRLLHLLLHLILLLHVGAMVGSGGGGGDAVDDEVQGQGVDSRVRLLIVASGGRVDVKDGHRRLFRAAKGIGLPVQMVTVKDPSLETSRILQVIRQHPYKPDDILVLTNSDQYLPAAAPHVLAWRILGEALKQEAEVLIPILFSPLILNPELEKEYHKVEEELRKLKDNKTRESSVKGRTAEDLVLLKNLLHQQDILKVKGKQYQRKVRPDTKNFRAYAFAGLVASIEDLLVAATAGFDGDAAAAIVVAAAPDAVINATDTSSTAAATGTVTATKIIEAVSPDGEEAATTTMTKHVAATTVAGATTRDRRGPGSLAHLWHSLALDVALRYSLGVALDHQHIVFQDAATTSPEWFGYEADGSLKLEIQGLKLASLIYAAPGTMPLQLANIVAREVGVKLPCPQCLDEPLKTERLTSSEAPRVMVTVVVERPTPFFRVFLSRLKDLSYPKQKIFLSFYVTPAAEQHLETVEEFLEEVVDQYLEGALLDPHAGPNVAKSYQFLWNTARKEGMDYLFFLDPIAHLTHPDAVQHLITRNRSVVGPLLTSQDGLHHNIYSGEDRMLNLGHTGERYVKRLKKDDAFLDFSAGLLQVEQVESALLLSRDVLSSARVNFTSYGENFTQGFVSHLLEQGFIPYATNEEIYGKLLNDKNYTSDIWSLEKNDEEYYDLYVSKSPLSSEEAESSSAECRNVGRFLVFNDVFAGDLLQEAQKTPWQDLSDEEEKAQVLVPPTGELTKQMNVLTQSVIRSVFKNKYIQIPESGGRVSLVKGPGHYLPDGKFVALLCLQAMTEDSQLELLKGETKCKLRLTVGEVAYFKRTYYPKITFTGPTSFAALIL
ncbi:uncharacterized protein LOC121857239 [Homarus americanus]|uniref:uncharacterized protein LOC121857239 n=1 Tax=Homarus americanus TaxID=6706 RepID=UPI001C43B2E8|nr:uncharacterized protein LOC121857239 [Homarus americanus]